MATPCCFVMASICARFSGLMYFMRSLMSGAFWPFTSRSMWTCHSPGLIGGTGGLVCACAPDHATAIARVAIKLHRLPRCMRVFLGRNLTPGVNDEGLTGTAGRGLE